MLTHARMNFRTENQCDDTKLIYFIFLSSHFMFKLALAAVFIHN